MENLWNQISKLSQNEQMLLAQQILSNLNAKDNSPIPIELQSELNRRKKLEFEGKISFNSWDVVKKKLETKYNIG